jgi:hypothetical protein
MRRVHRPVEVGGRVAGQVRVVFEVEHTARVTAALASAGSEIFALADTHSVELAPRSTDRACRLGRSRPAVTNRTGTQRRGMVRGMK